MSSESLAVNTPTRQSIHRVDEAFQSIDTMKLQDASNKDLEVVNSGQSEEEPTHGGLYLKNINYKPQVQKSGSPVPSPDTIKSGIKPKNLIMQRYGKKLQKEQKEKVVVESTIFSINVPGSSREQTSPLSVAPFVVVAAMPTGNLPHAKR